MSLRRVCMILACTRQCVCKSLHVCIVNESQILSYFQYSLWLFYWAQAQQKTLENSNSSTIFQKNNGVLIPTVHKLRTKESSSATRKPLANSSSLRQTGERIFVPKGNLQAGRLCQNVCVPMLTVSVSMDYNNRSGFYELSLQSC